MNIDSAYLNIWFINKPFSDAFYEPDNWLPEKSKSVVSQITWKNVLYLSASFGMLTETKDELSLTSPPENLESKFPFDILHTLEL